MDKTFGPIFKKILILDIVSAVIFIAHCIVFVTITSQDTELHNFAAKMLPSYVVRVILWGIIVVVIILLRAMSYKKMKDAGTPTYTDRAIYTCFNYKDSFILHNFDSTVYDYVGGNCTCGESFAERQEREGLTIIDVIPRPVMVGGKKY